MTIWLPLCAAGVFVSAAIGLGHLSLQRLFFIILVHVLFTRVRSAPRRCCCCCTNSALCIIYVRESISIQHQRASALHVLDTDVVEDGRDSPEAIIVVHVLNTKLLSNFMRLY